MDDKHNSLPSSAQALRSLWLPKTGKRKCQHVRTIGSEKEKHIHQARVTLVLRSMSRLNNPFLFPSVLPSLGVERIDEDFTHAPVQLDTARRANTSHDDACSRNAGLGVLGGGERCDSSPNSRRTSIVNGGVFRCSESPRNCIIHCNSSSVVDGRGTKTGDLDGVGDGVVFELGGTGTTMSVTFSLTMSSARCLM